MFIHLFHTLLAILLIYLIFTPCPRATSKISLPDDAVCRNFSKKILTKMLLSIKLNNVKLIGLTLVMRIETMFNKVIEMSMLYDFYGQLLTDKQRDVMQLHYEDDYSLSEIGEILAISRQAVHDAIKKAEKSLKDYEEKLKLLQKFNETIIRYNRIQELADQAIQGLEKENIKDMGIKNILIEIKNELKEDS